MATIHGMVWGITDETANAAETVRFGPSTNNVTITKTEKMILNKKI